MRLFCGVIFVVVGVLMAFFFESYRDFARRVAGSNAGGSLPDRRHFIIVIRVFGVLVIVLGGLMCWYYFH